MVTILEPGNTQVFRSVVEEVVTQVAEVLQDPRVSGQELITQESINVAPAIVNPTITQ